MARNNIIHHPSNIIHLIHIIHIQQTSYIYQYLHTDGRKFMALNNIIHQTSNIIHLTFDTASQNNLKKKSFIRNGKI